MGWSIRLFCRFIGQRIPGLESKENRFGLEFDIKLPADSFANVFCKGHQFLARTTAVMDQRQSMR